MYHEPSISETNDCDGDTVTWPTALLVCINSYTLWYQLQSCWLHGQIDNTWLHHDDVIKWKYFPRYWPFVLRINRSPVNSPHKGQWRGTLMFSLICAWIYDWVNNGEAGDLRRYRAHSGVIAMIHHNCGKYTAFIRFWTHNIHHIALTHPSGTTMRSLLSRKLEKTSCIIMGLSNYINPVDITWCVDSSHFDAWHVINL